MLLRARKTSLAFNKHSLFKSIIFLVNHLHLKDDKKSTPIFFVLPARTEFFIGRGRADTEAIRSVKNFKNCYENHVV